MDSLGQISGIQGIRFHLQIENLRLRDMGSA